MTWARRAAFVALCLATLAGLAWGVQEMLRPAPPRDPGPAFRALVGSGAFDAAEGMLRRHLERYPDDDRAHLLMGELLVERPDRPDDDEAFRLEAERALAHLDRVRADDPARAARSLLYRGKALHALGRFDAMEAALEEALRIDPLVPEAGWILLELYYLQGRPRDAHDLALRLHEIEPDPRDRVRLLLELVRQDAQPPDPASRVELYEAVVAARPDDVHPAVAHGLGLVLSSQIDPGLAALQGLVERHPAEPIAWDALLTGLDAASELEAMARVLDRLPDEFADDPRFARHRGRLAQERGDWPAAIDAYREAVEANPIDPALAHRLGLSLRNAGRVEEAQPFIDAMTRYQQASAEVRSLYDEAAAAPRLGLDPRPDLYRRLADLRRRMLRPAEARAWLRLALETRPDDPEALAALRALDGLPPGSIRSE